MWYARLDRAYDPLGKQFFLFSINKKQQKEVTHLSHPQKIPPVYCHCFVSFSRAIRASIGSVSTLKDNTGNIICIKLFIYPMWLSKCLFYMFLALQNTLLSTLTPS